MKAYQCPYEKACKCSMEEECLECETFQKVEGVMYLEKGPKVDISLVDDLIDEKNAEIRRLTSVLEDIISTNDLGLNDYDIVKGVMSTAKDALTTNP